MKKRRVYYHCSQIDHGARLDVLRRSPRVKSDNEPVTPRLCVSPTVPQCLAARLFTSTVYIYRSLPRRAVKPCNVWDQFITDEMWLLPGDSLLKCDVIKADTISSIFDDVARWHFRTTNKSDYKVRVAVLWRAVVEMPQYAPKRLEKLVTIWIESLNIDPIFLFDTPKPKS